MLRQYRTVPIKRDPFARASLERRYTRHARGTHTDCRWCGRGLKASYSYAWVNDAAQGSVAWSPPFCSVGCYRAYTGDVR